MEKFYLGIGGVAQSGKDLCGKIILKILSKRGYTPQRFALADELKNEVEEFLNIKCNTSSHTEDLEEKNRIRPFLVWYGCYQRFKEPDYWIRKMERSISINPQCDVVICTDIRFKNEADWIHKNNGWLIHLTKYKADKQTRLYHKAPNKEELENDPVVSELADYRIIWEDLSHKGLNAGELINNKYLNREVLKSLQSCPHFLKLSS